MTLISKPNTGVQSESDPAVILTYALRTNPSPLTISPALPLTARLGSLEFIITNNTVSPQIVKKIMFEIEVGSDTGAALTPTTAGTKATVSDINNWSVGLPGTTTSGKARYTLEPASGSSVTLAANRSVAVQIYDIQTVKVSGTTKVTVIEEMETPRTTKEIAFFVTTFPDNFFFNGLIANVLINSKPVPVAQVTSDQLVTLTWNSSVAQPDAFTIFYSSADRGQQQATPTEFDEWTTPAPLTSDTVFTLTVKVDSPNGGQPLTAAMSTVVSVRNPALIAKSIKAGTAESTALTRADTLDVTETSTLRGNVTIGTAGAQSASLTINGNLTGTTANFSKAVTIGTAAAPSDLTVTGDYWGKGALQLHAPEGNGRDGSALIQARDRSGTSKIGLILRTQDRDRWNDVISLTYDGKVNIGSAENKLNVALLVTGKIQSSSKQGGLYLDDTGEVFVGNNKMDEEKIDNIGFAVPALGFNTFQIEKKTANVGIGTMAPQGRLHIKDYFRTGFAWSQVTMVIEGSSENAFAPSLALINTHGGKPVTDAPMWVIYMNDNDSLAISNRGKQGEGSTANQMEITKSGVYFNVPIIVQNAFGGNSGTYSQLASWMQNNHYASWQDVPGPSDIRLKQDVRPITGALDKVNRLQGALHRWNDAGLDYLTQDRVNAVSAGPDATEEQHEALRRAERQKAVAKLAGDHIGLIAQDVEAIVPEVVFENEDGHKCIRYPQLVALLIEAIKEQDQTIKEHTQRLAQHQAAIDRLTRD
jgi:hypothetical protein